MPHKPILIVPGQANSIFFEIFFKSIKNNKFKSPILIVCNLKNFIDSAKKFRFKKNLNLISKNNVNIKFNSKKINIIDVKIKKNKKKQLENEKDYIERCFYESFKILKKKITYKFLNGPINKKKFLGNKYLGITEYISDYFNKKKTCMLIFNDKISVCPITTHLPLKLVQKKITKSLIKDKLQIIDSFYKKRFNFKPKIGVTGLNPHCESISSFNEDDKIVSPAIRAAKKIGISVSGPYAADTIFLKQNRKKFDVIMGMYHDQVLAPFKTLYEYDAINITLGLPFLRISPDHGPNEKMIDKNLSNPTSLIKALKFLDKN